MDAALRIEVRAPDELAGAWQRLWSGVPDATPFMSPAWLLPWARVYAPERCWIATVTGAAGDLLGCLPMFWWQRRLLLAGTGPSDHGDALFLPGFERWAGPLLDALLAAIDRPIDRIELHQLPASSSMLTLSPPRGWEDEVEPGETCPVLTLGGEDGMAHVREAARANWRYVNRRLARAGARVERVPDEEVDDAMNALERLHAQRWARRGESGVLVDPLLRRLLRDAAPELARAGLLRLHRVRRQGETVGVLMAMHGARRTCCFLSGFDPAIAPLGPGVALVGATIVAAAHEGDLAVDFLRGREPYKYEWSAVDEARHRRVFTPCRPE